MTAESPWPIDTLPKEDLAKMRPEFVEKLGHSKEIWEAWEAGKISVRTSHCGGVKSERDLKFYGYQIMDGLIGHFGPFPEEIIKALRRGVPCEPVESFWCKRVWFGCTECGEKVRWFFDGVEITTDSECKYPDGLPVYSCELDIPSGIMVFGNDFRKLYTPSLPDDWDEEKPSINGNWGCKHRFDLFAIVGMGHGFVSNTSPEVYQRSDEVLTISRWGYNRETDEEIDPEGERIGRIITDLWWYCVVDGDDYQSRGAELPKKQDDEHMVKVKPGRYRLTHQFHLIEDPDDGTPVPQDYAILEWIGDCPGK